MTRVYSVRTPSLSMPAASPPYPPKQAAPMPDPVEQAAPTPTPALTTEHADPCASPVVTSIVSPSSSSSPSAPSFDIHCHVDLSASQLQCSPPPQIHFHLHTSSSPTAARPPSLDVGSPVPPPSYSSLGFTPSSLRTFLSSPTKE